MSFHFFSTCYFLNTVVLLSAFVAQFTLIVLYKLMHLVMCSMMC